MSGLNTILALRRGITQTDLARSSGVPQSTLSRAAAGGDVLVSNAIKIARALGVSVEEAFAHLAPPDDAAPTAAETAAQEGGA